MERWNGKPLCREQFLTHLLARKLVGHLDLILAVAQLGRVLYCDL
jgi:hypothetical protein